MFAEYDTSQFPLVNIQLGNTIRDNEDYDNFVREWTKLYLLKKDFLFIIDARMTGFVPFQYAYNMSEFINKLKKRENQYLKRSIIIIHNRIVEYTLRFIFKMSSPTAPVYLVYSIDDALKLNNILTFPELDLNIESKLKEIHHVYISP